MIDRNIEVKTFLGNVLKGGNVTAIIDLDTSLKNSRKPLVNIADSCFSNDDWIVVIDTEAKYNLWQTLLGGRLNKRYEIIYPDNLYAYTGASCDLIVDLYYNIYKENESLLQDINNIYFNNAWFILDNLSSKSTNYIKGKVRQEFYSIYVDISKLTSSIISENPIVLMPFHLNNKVENEPVDFYTGIPKTEKEYKYSEFSPIFSNNEKINLLCTAQGKYEYLNKRFLFYKDLYSNKQKELNRQQLSFLVSKYKESLKATKEYLNEKRISCIKSILTEEDDTTAIFILKENKSKAFNSFCLNFNISQDSSDDLINYAKGFTTVITSPQILKIGNITDIVIIGEINATTVSKINRIIQEFPDSTISVPYFVDTKDEKVIKIIEDTYNCLRWKE